MFRRSNARKTSSSRKQEKIRYAVVGLGYIAQIAVLPAFKNAASNSKLTALISGDKAKLETLGKQYNVNITIPYEDYDALMETDEIDAVYIALPNSLHMDFAVSALEKGKHVLCEKPLAVTEKGCRRIIEAAERGNAKLMTAYRLHFEEATLKAMEMIKNGKIGEPRIFNSVFSFQIKEENIRLEKKLGGGTVYDLGIYCINAARQVFRSEPIEVFAMSTTNSDPRFSEVDEMTTASLRFSNGGLATFTSSFGAADSSVFDVIGTKGCLTLDPAFEYAEPLKHHLTIQDKTTVKKFKKVDQFSPELIYFSECILKGKEPEPSGREGLADVRIIQAIYHSAKTGRAVRLENFEKRERPTMKQHIKKPSIKEPSLLHAYSPSEDNFNITHKLAHTNGFHAESNR